ncbi:uncharacterized protein L3040_009054 [Drepanopeziza brunnea f. sp. 'multigermtubi']|uniref:uncharacterized protein n=1 Tax=Drepanopeziza brunnea f. sp. 'multigermtubi' TaxID=698441 RepID=UPI002387EDA4|nr:hypothetical protein L3040_009054 [Drepanopeziza brunnea f. sp. 'multigermtubi']
MDTSSSPAVFVLDFDGTITTKDTISTLSKLAVEFQKSKGKDLTKELQDLVARYHEDYSKHVAEYRPAGHERRTLDEEIEYMRSLTAVELRSFGRMSASEIFRDIDVQDWPELGREAVAGGEVKIRKGFQDFVAGIDKLGAIWGIVSANFSAYFIRSVLMAVGVDNGNVQVQANWPGNSGELRGPHGRALIATSDAKLGTTRELLKFWDADNEYRDRTSKFVYIGDSGTDIECLTADGAVGIVMSADGEGGLIETLKRVNVDVDHISKYEKRRGSSVCWARDFEEILKSPLLNEAN